MPDTTIEKTRADIARLTPMKTALEVAAAAAQTALSGASPEERPAMVRDIVMGVLLAIKTDVGQATMFAAGAEQNPTLVTDRLTEVTVELADAVASLGVLEQAAGGGV